VVVSPPPPPLATALGVTVNTLIVVHYNNIYCNVIYLSSSSYAIATVGAARWLSRGGGGERGPIGPSPPPPEQSDNCRFARRLIVYDRRCPRTRRTAVGGSRYTRTAARQHSNNNNKRTTTTARAPHDTRTGCRCCRTRPRRIRDVRLSLSSDFFSFFSVAFSLSLSLLSPVITRHRRQVSPSRIRRRRRVRWPDNLSWFGAEGCRVVVIATDVAGLSEAVPCCVRDPTMTVSRICGPLPSWSGRWPTPSPCPPPRQFAVQPSPNAIATYSTEGCRRHCPSCCCCCAATPQSVSTVSTWRRGCRSSNVPWKCRTSATPSPDTSPTTRSSFKSKTVG